PLSVRILGALAFGVAAGALFNADFGLGRFFEPGSGPAKFFSPVTAQHFRPLSDVVLRLLGALATPLIFLSVAQSLMLARFTGRRTGHLFFLLMVNTVVAILVGLAVANVVQPGRWSELTRVETSKPLPR